MENELGLERSELMRAQAGDNESCERFFAASLDYAKRRTQTYIPQSLAAQALISACLYGLMEALRVWDGEGATAFIDFAEPFIVKRLDALLVTEPPTPGGPSR